MMPKQRPPRNGRKPARSLDVTSVALTLFFSVVIALQFLALRGKSVELAYSDFQSLVAAKQVDNLEVTPTRTSGTLKLPGAADWLPASDAIAVKGKGEPYRFTAVRVADDRLAQTLSAAGIRCTGGFDGAWPSMLLSWVVG
jgi:cell division protease FtsH